MKRLRTRLQQQKDAHDGSIRIQAPLQLEIPEDMPVDQAIASLKALGLRPPLLVKPLWTDGREGSHGLAVVHDLGSMRRLLQGEVSPDLKPPVVVQQFVEHGGVLYKVGERERPTQGNKAIQRSMMHAWTAIDGMGMV